MNRVSILPADTYTALNKTVITNIDIKTLFMLYEPIIGHLPISLYLNFLFDLDKAEMMSTTFTHHHLMNNMHLKLEDIVQAREKLEAIGLIKTYIKKGDINNYTYELYSPLSAQEFFTHPLLNPLLYSYLGKKEYDKLICCFKLPKIDVSTFEDITIHFDELYNVEPNAHKGFEIEELKRINKNNLNINQNIDFDFITSSMQKGLLNDKTFDNQTKYLINSLCFLYKIDNIHLINIIKNCLNERGLIDKLKLKTACRNYYQFENDNKLPSLIYRSQPDNLKKQGLDDSKRSKIIYTFETLSPYDFLRAKYNGGNPTTRDAKMIESLMVDQSLNPGVVNVLIDYVTKINNNKLSKNFIETIAGQWKRLNIKTVEEAMRQAEKEHKKYQTNKVSTNNYSKAKQEKLPDWFDKDIKEDNLSKEEEAKIKDMLKEFQ